MTYFCLCSLSTNFVSFSQNQTTPLKFHLSSEISETNVRNDDFLAYLTHTTQCLKIQKIPTSRIFRSTVCLLTRPSEGLNHFPGRIPAAMEQRIISSFAWRLSRSHRTMVVGRTWPWSP